MEELKPICVLQSLRKCILLWKLDNCLEFKPKWPCEVNLEAVRAAFKKAWQERDYATIIAVARKIPENVLQEDRSC